MYDQIKYNKTHLYSWRLFIFIATLNFFLLTFTFYLQYLVKWSSFSILKNCLFIITILLLFLVSGEFYQFYHIVNFYNNLSWLYDYDEGYWSLEVEFRRTRLVNNYVTICLLAKFWHLIFIAGFWLFFLLRSYETQKVNHLLLAANYQNFIILYIMIWLYMYPWFKYIFRKFLSNSYTWFSLDSRELFFNFIVYDLTLYIKSFMYLILSKFKILYSNDFNSLSFFYWTQQSIITNFESYHKGVIRDFLINSLVSFK